MKNISARRRVWKAAVLISTLAGFCPLASHAEETGSGHYMPGSIGSFVDALPGREAFAYMNAFTFYDASAGKTKTFELGGLIAANVSATAYADTSLLLYQSPLRLLGGDYALALGIPYVWMEVTGQVRTTGPGGAPVTVTRRDTVDGLGDLMLYPFILGWNKLGGDLKYDVRMGIYAPTGRFRTGRLANAGRNYWTFEPGVYLGYLSSRIGLEISAYAGMDFNTENEATDYQSGSQFHLDFTIAEHLPLFGGFVGVGAGGFYYEQVTGDSGSGARLGSFEGMAVGVGPVLSYATKICQRDVVAEVKWLPELDAENRLRGDYVWFKLGIVF